MEKPMEKRKLMASFTTKTKIKDFIEYLYNNKLTDKVFILENKKQKNVYIVTYNLLKEMNMSNLREFGVLNTLIIQRNKDTNTLYSINALNYILEEESLKTEKPKRDIKIDWSKYQNVFITTSDKKVNIIHTNLYKFIDFKRENFNINKLQLDYDRKTK